MLVSNSYHRGTHVVYTKLVIIYRYTVSVIWNHALFLTCTVLQLNAQQSNCTAQQNLLCTTINDLFQNNMILKQQNSYLILVLIHLYPTYCLPTIQLQHTRGLLVCTMCWLFIPTPGKSQNIWHCGIIHSNKENTSEY